jgi:hypothetical protein
MASSKNKKDALIKSESLRKSILFELISENIVKLLCYKKRIAKDQKQLNGNSNGR